MTSKRARSLLKRIVIPLVVIVAAVFISDTFILFLPWHRQQSTITEPKSHGSATQLKVCVNYPPGKSVPAGQHLPDLHLYRDGEEIGRMIKSRELSEGCGTWEVEVGHSYSAKAYWNDMYSGETKAIVIGQAGRYELSLLLTPAALLQVKVYCKDGVTPLPNALILVYSHENVPWRNQCTDRTGSTTAFRLQPTTREEEHYRIDVIIEDEIVASSEVKLNQKPGVIQVFNITTPLEPGDIPDVCVSWT